MTNVTILHPDDEKKAPVPVLVPIFHPEDIDLMMMPDSEWDEIVRMAKERGRTFTWAFAEPKK